MTEKHKISINDKKIRILVRLIAGCDSFFHNRFYTYLILTYIAGLVLIFAITTPTLTTSLLLFLGLILLIVVAGHPIQDFRINRAFNRIGFTNSLGNTPILFEIQNITGQFYRYTFCSLGIPLDEWADRQLAIENTLNITIQDICSMGHTNYIIQLVAYKGRYIFPDTIKWDKSYLSYDPAILIIGEQIGGQFSISLNDYPHILIGGATGSGKSVLLKCLLMQCVLHGYDVYIADFKGGIDYFPIWHQRCTLVTDLSHLLTTLATLIQELEKRKKLLLDAHVTNIDEFNEQYPAPLHRIILAFDEVAEALDKSGLDKNHKEEISKIESYLSTIARTGRAMGIHLFLATQRPDANILTGQIKSNINYRICGRADNVLSQIILDTADANDKIPKNAKGLFINQDKIIFKGYLFDENKELKF